MFFVSRFWKLINCFAKKKINNSIYLKREDTLTAHSVICQFGKDHTTTTTTVGPRWKVVAAKLYISMLLFE